MEYQQLFKPILQEDEEIVRTFKPNKKRFVVVSGIFASIFFLIFMAFGIFFINGPAIFMPDFYVFEAFPSFAIMGYVFMAITVLGLIITWVSVFVTYNKTVYAYTNKRILIRRGFIGADYATLDFEMIGGLMVNVGLLDRLVKGGDNPGTIIFGSAASPVYAYGSSNRQIISPFAFRHIDKPYDAYREMKRVIDAYKDSKNK